MYDRNRIGDCCYECENRHTACHDSCDKYKQVKAEYEAKKKRISDAKDLARTYDVYHYMRITNQRKINLGKGKGY